MAPALESSPLGPDAPHPLPPLPRSVSPHSAPWVPVLALAASEYPAQCFIHTLDSLIHFPEHSSSTILRADILADVSFDDPDALDNDRGKGKAKATERQFDLDGFHLERRVRRRILPKRPQFDHAMEQDCLVYSRPGPDGAREVLVLFVVDLDLLERDTHQRTPPYYHPQVSTLAFRYLPASLSPDPDAPSPTLRIDLVPLPDAPLSAPLDPRDRLFRTSLSLLKTIDKRSKGSSAGYEKRVNHDLLVPKEQVQDVYQRLKSKYSRVITSVDDPTARITFPRFLASSWVEKTDPSKHVFEDVAICAWLICLWQGMYPVTASGSGADQVGRAEPKGGFVDVGCGNGLLVYLLNSEGYRGYGLDLRSRRSWSLYSPAPDLRLTSLSPPTMVRTALETDAAPFPKGAFLIGNHADELSPWIPLLAAVTPGSAYLNIPCCLHDLVGRFESKTYSIPRAYLDSLPAAPPTTTKDGPALPDAHPLLYPFYHPTPSYLVDKSRYASYQLFLAHLSLACGFVPEREALRIPSTKNYGLVGRKRLWDSCPRGEGGDAADAERARIDGERRAREHVGELMDDVERRLGNEGWIARVPEGKAGDH
ncbi:hypothetical protein JCM11491_002262 [Sporobolomyces phaffii]